VSTKLHGFTPSMSALSQCNCDVIENSMQGTVALLMAEFRTFCATRKSAIYR